MMCEKFNEFEQFLEELSLKTNNEKITMLKRQKRSKMLKFSKSLENCQNRFGFRLKLR